MSEKRFLIKCDCGECNCENATPDGVCHECQSGLHVRDREAEMDGPKLTEEDDHE
jgi:hypothetical protein